MSHKIHNNKVIYLTSNIIFNKYFYSNFIISLN